MPSNNTNKAHDLFVEKYLPVLMSSGAYLKFPFKDGSNVTTNGNTKISMTRNSINNGSINSLQENLITEIEFTIGENKYELSNKVRATQMIFRSGVSRRFENFSLNENGDPLTNENAYNKLNDDDFLDAFKGIFLSTGDDNNYAIAGPSSRW